MSEPIEDTHHLSRRTTPTWEVELLISGVAVFAMLQLPGWLDDQVFALEPRLDADWRQILILSYIYAKSAAVILRHDLRPPPAPARAAGSRWWACTPSTRRASCWTACGLGPIQRKIEQEIDRPMPTRIERADNLATTVFALGVMLATMLIAIAIAATTLYGLGMLAAKLSLGRLDASICHGCDLRPGHGAFHRAGHAGPAQRRRMASRRPVAPVRPRLLAGVFPHGFQP